MERQEKAPTRLELGRVAISHATSAALEASKVEGVLLLARHLHGDWGDLTVADDLQNELALLLGLRVLSRYALPDGREIWITTEADRSVTRVLLAEGTKGG